MGHWGMERGGLTGTVTSDHDLSDLTLHRALKEHAPGRAWGAGGLAYYSMDLF